MTNPAPTERHPEAASASAATTTPSAADLFATPRTDQEAPSEPNPTCPSIGSRALDELAAGQRLGDFDLLVELGRGAFARVFLARQVSLDRGVALKVSGTRDTEGQTLARLEHDHIVRVYDESTDWERNLHLLWMQYAPGASLQQVMTRLAQREQAWGGEAFLEVVAQLAAEAPGAKFHYGGEPLDLSAMRDLGRLQRCDRAEAVAWLGARLAEALAYAHSRGVIHRDVKPANILLARHGRPLLADFNVSLRTRDDGHAEGRVGGTLAYMAPEHLDAFLGVAPPDVVDARSDLFSLGVVLAELLTGRRPFADPPRDSLPREAVRALAEARRHRTLPLAGVPEVLGRVVSRCLEPDPRDRFQSAEELVQALDGCGELSRAEKAMPAAGPMTRLVQRWPEPMSVALSLLPHVIAAAFDFTYNILWLGSYPGGAVFVPMFVIVALSYTAGAFVTTGWLAYLLGRPVYRAVEAMRRGEQVVPDGGAALRAQSLRKPLWGMAQSGLGWLPGGLMMPLMLSWLVAPVDFQVYLHFILSFTIAGLIAMTYTSLASLYMVLRVGYPSLWADARHFRATARTELGNVAGQLWLMQLLAGLVPLAVAAAAMAALLLAPTEQVGTASYATFQLLVLVLIVFGMAGCWLAVAMSGWLRRTLVALIGDDPAQGW